MSSLIPVNENKEQYMELLLIGDEQEDMILRYLERCELYALCDEDEVCGVCAVTDEGGGVLEIKNIAIRHECQGRGLGKLIIELISVRYSGRYSVLRAGTGDSPFTVPFYENCGFTRAYTIPDFFTDNYDHPIFEGGVQLRDMIYFEKEI